jgi:protein-L-isoaspartate(D-aspartate) O-methyltransferase
MRVGISNLYDLSPWKKLSERRYLLAIIIVLVALPYTFSGLHAEPHDPFAAAREKMVLGQIFARGVRDQRVLAAMKKVPRHAFVPPGHRDHSYRDLPLPIGGGQTISQPYVVAYMTEQLRLKGNERVLEVGTGSGYQAAVLAELCKEVYTIEIVESLARQAETDLKRLGYKNVQVRTGDGYRGWPGKAPFDAIIVTAAPDHVPQPLLDQLKVGGRMVLPVGGREQELILITRDEKGLHRSRLLAVRFVPMTGEAQQKRR